MSTEIFLAREPILNRQQELVGYDLRWVGKDALPNGAGLFDLLTTQDKNWRLGSHIVVTDQPPTPLETATRLPKSAYIVELKGVTATPEIAQSLLEVGLACCVRTPAPTPLPPEMLPKLAYFSLDVKQLGPTLKKVSTSLRKIPAKQIGRNIASPESYAVAKDAELDFYQGDWFLRPGRQAGAVIGPTYSNLVTLMRLSQENAPVQKLEEVLKRDAALSYKLLRYINSVGFGLSCEIQSLRHAVVILGYQNLYRWLGLLMVNAARKSASDALVTTAVTRGRLVELLGQDLLGESDRDNLFVVGMFSLLEAIMRVSMEEIISQIPLSEAVRDALTTRQGPYGPFLQLAEACEQLGTKDNLDKAETLAMSLNLTPTMVNGAQIDAMVWTDALGGQ
jgi:EAL and modified HD-GYP domain-containing signal transduction protein